MTAAFIALVLAAGLLWACSHISPFVWLSRAALHSEAVRIQLWSSIGVAYADFRENYRATHAVLRITEGER